MFAKVFNLNRSEGTQSGMQSKFCKTDAFYFKSLISSFAKNVNRQ